MIELHNVSLKLGHRVSAEDLNSGQYDHVVVATGITPRTPAINGIDHPKAILYTDVIKGNKAVGNKVAVIGAGGIGFDVCELISHSGPSGAVDREVFAREWGIDFDNHPRGGVTGVEPIVAKSTEKFGCYNAKTPLLVEALARPQDGHID